MKRIKSFLALLVIMMASSISAMADIASGNFGECHWVIDDDSVLTISPRPGYSGIFTEWKGTPPWYDNRESIKSVKFEETVTLRTGYKMFEGCTNLTNIDFTGLNTGELAIMSQMFEGCTQLKSLDLSSFNTSSVEFMNSTFQNCSNLTTLNLTHFSMENLNSNENVNSYKNIFQGCTRLNKIYSTGEPSTLKEGTFKSLPTKETCKIYVPRENAYSYRHAVGWDELTIDGYVAQDTCGTCHWIIDGEGVLTVSPLDGIRGTLDDWTSLSTPPWYNSRYSIKSVKFEGTINLATGHSMFQNCTDLTSIDFTGLNTENATDMYNMFHYCPKLTALDLSGFNTTNVTNLSGMFSDCENLKSLDISNFNTAKVTYIDELFNNCRNLTTLNITGLDMQVVKESFMRSMFGNCNSLRSIYSNCNTPTMLLEQTFSSLPEDTKTNCKLYVPKDAVSDYQEADGWKELNIEGYYAHGISGTCYWIIDSEGVLTFSPVEGNSGTLENWENRYGGTPWYQNRDDIKKVKFEGTIYLTTGEDMFDGCRNLTSIDFTGLKTENVTNMKGMFYSCESITTLDLSGFNTNNVTKFSSMFASCMNLKSLDISNFNTENATSMSDMFENCQKLATLNVTGLNMNNVSEYQRMFRRCDNLKYIYSTNAPTTLKEETFEDLPTKETCKLYVPKEYADSYSNAVGWKELTIDGYVAQDICGTCRWIIDSEGVLTVSPLDGISGTLNDWKSLPTPPWYESRLSIKSVKFEGTINLKTGHHMFNGCINLTSIDFNGLNTEDATDMYCMFYNCTNLKSLDISKFKTEKITNTEGMFSGCENLTTLNITGLNMQAVHWKQEMFSGCTALKSIYSTINEPSTLKEGTFSSLPTKETCKLYVPAASKSLYATATGWDILKIDGYIAEDICGTCHWIIDSEGVLTVSPLDGISGTLNDWGVGTPPWYEKRENITSVKFEGTINLATGFRMFDNCTNLTSIDFTGLKTENVTSLFRMFNYCSNITTLDLCGFNTANVTDFAFMFEGCTRLKSLNISNFNTEKVKGMYYMFKDCSSITALDLSSFNTANVGDLSHMFDGCTELKSLDISNFNTEEVVNMSNMFSGCSNLATLNITGLNMQKVDATLMADMFKDCNALVSIISTSKTPSTLKNGTFTSLPTRENECKLSVPAASRTLYAAADGWKELSIAGEWLDLTDKDPTLIEGTYAPGKVTYTRTASEGIATFCLPFEINVAEDDNETIEKFYTVYPTAFLKESNTLRLLIIEANGVIPAGTPFIARCLQNGEVSFKNSAEVTFAESYTNPDPSALYVFEDNGTNSVLQHCTSLNVSVGGTYQKWTNPGDEYYAFSKSGSFSHTSSINPFRMYIHKTGAAASSNAFEIELLFDDEDDLTDLKDALTSASKQSTPAYNIMGHKVDANTSGIIIVNGSKYYNK